jgi:hypothetical protein
MIYDQISLMSRKKYENEILFKISNLDKFVDNIKIKKNNSIVFFLTYFLMFDQKFLKLVYNMEMIYL